MENCGVLLNSDGTCDLTFNIVPQSQSSDLVFTTTDQEALEDLGLDLVKEEELLMFKEEKAVVSKIVVQTSPLRFIVDSIEGDDELRYLGFDLLSIEESKAPLPHNHADLTLDFVKSFLIHTRHKNAMSNFHQGLDEEDPLEDVRTAVSVAKRCGLPNSIIVKGNEILDKCSSKSSFEMTQEEIDEQYDYYFSVVHRTVNASNRVRRRRAMRKKNILLKRQSIVL